MQLPPELRAKFDAFDGLPLECDGMSRIIAFVLRVAGVPHRAVTGPLVVDGQVVVSAHFWIDLGDGWLIDYRARMWAGNHPHVPRGVLRMVDCPRVHYAGDAVDISIRPGIFDYLTRSLRAES